MRSLQAGERILKSVTRFLPTRLKLMVNEAKSAVGRPWERTFLGFTFSRRMKRQVSPKAIQSMKERVREKTGRTLGRRLEVIIQDLRKYLVGWKAYWVCRGKISFQRAGFLDQTAVALLPLEAVGPSRVPGAASARGQQGSGLEYGQVGPWPVAFEPKSCPGVRFTEQVLHVFGFTPTV